MSVKPRKERNVWRGCLVKTARQRCRLTQKQLAREVGLHLNTISKIEQGTKGASAATIFALANALNLGFGYLVQPPPPEDQHAIFNVS